MRANHTSYFDVLPVMMGLGVTYRFVAKGEVNQMPFIGTFLNQMGHLSFDRHDTGARLKQVDEIEDVLAAGRFRFCFSGGDVYAGGGSAAISVGGVSGGGGDRRAGDPGVVERDAGFLRDGTILPRPTSVTITLSAPIYPGRELPASDPNHLQEIVRLRDAAREAIGKYAGEPVL